MNTRVGLSFRPKACLRCGGDAYLSREDGAEWRCLQCGRLVPEPAVVAVKPAATEREPAAATARAA